MHGWHHAGWRVVALLSLTFGLLACAAPAPSAPSPAARGGPGAANSGPTDQSAATDRLIIRTATLTVLVSDVADVAARTSELATSMGGFVVSANQREDGPSTSATVTIRVPAPRLDEALGRIKALAVKVRNEQVTGKDVTEEFVDTDARLRNLRATEARYLDLLQQSATVGDILSVEKELTTVRGQIEQLQGRLQFLQRSAELATVTVEVRAASGLSVLLPDWNLPQAATSAVNALLNAINTLLVLAIWFIVFTPLWLPAWLLLRRWRRRSRPAAEPPVEEVTVEPDSE
jgi:hypothetical protein